MSPRDSFGVLMHRVKRAQRRVDPEDVVQSVYRRFTGPGYGLKTWDAPWALLTVITVRKSLDRAQYHLAQRSNGVLS
jgi:hypothetical protein